MKTNERKRKGMVLVLVLVRWWVFGYLGFGVNCVWGNVRME